MTAQETSVERAAAPAQPTAEPKSVAEYDLGVRRLLENFSVIAATEGGHARLRDLVLGLALHGALVPYEAGDAALELRRRKPPTELPACTDALFVLPRHWCWVFLEQVVASVADGDHQPPPRASAGVPFLTIGNVSGGTIDFRDTRFVPRAYFDALDRRRVPSKGDLIYTVVGSYGIPLSVDTDREFCVQRHIAILRPDGTCDAAFLYLFLRSPLAYKQAATCATGIAQPTVGLKPLRRFKVPLPPLAEQKRIVAKVDELMRLLDDLETKQSKKRATQTRLRTAALDALRSAAGPEAFETAWKRVAENFAVLFEHAASVGPLRRVLLRLATTGTLSPSGAAEWKVCTVAEVADCRLGKMLDKVKNRGTLRPYLRNTNVHWFRLELGDIKQMPFEDEECEEYELRAGDLVVCEGGHGIGRTAVWNAELVPMMFQKALHRLRPRPTMDSTFLAFQLKVAADEGVMSTYFTGAGIPHLTGRRLAEMAVNVPPLAEQKRIVAKVERLMKLCDDLEAKLRRAEETAAKLVEAVVAEMVA